MAMTVTRVWARGGTPVGHDLRAFLVELDISSYTNPNGETLTAAMLGLKRIDEILFTNVEPTTAANRDSRLEWNKASSKVFAIVVSTGAQVANGVDLGTFRALVLGGASPA